MKASLKRTNFRNVKVEIHAMSYHSKQLEQDAYAKKRP